MTFETRDSVVQKLEKFLQAVDDAGPAFDPENPEDCIRPAVSYPTFPRELLVSAIQELSV